MSCCSVLFCLVSLPVTSHAVMLSFMLFFFFFHCVRKWMWLENLYKVPVAWVSWPMQESLPSGKLACSLATVAIYESFIKNCVQLLKYVLSNEQFIQLFKWLFQPTLSLTSLLSYTCSLRSISNITPTDCDYLLNIHIPLSVGVSLPEPGVTGNQRMSRESNANCL